MLSWSKKILRCSRTYIVTKLKHIITIKLTQHLSNTMNNGHRILLLFAS